MYMSVYITILYVFKFTSKSLKYLIYLNTI